MARSKKSVNPFKNASDALDSPKPKPKPKATPAKSTGTKAQPTVRKAAMDAAERRRAQTGRERSSTNKGRRR